MKGHLLLSAVLAALLAALLGACGGDDNKDNNNAQTPIVTAPGPTAPADTGATGTTGKQTKSGSKKKSEKAEKLSYAAAKKVCKEFMVGPSASAEAIARAVSERYTSKPRADAAYDGCLAGFKQR